MGATLGACAAACDTEFHANGWWPVLARVQRDWLKEPISPADAACALWGRPDEFVLVNGNDIGSIRVPDHVAILGIDCGVVHEGVRAKYMHVRTTTSMGRVLIERILRHSAPGSPTEEHPLTHIDIVEFVERFRDRIPTRMKGNEFLERFGETGDPLARIEPDSLYKIRSRTEHHIYEHARAREFAALCTKESRSRDDSFLVLAGEILNASHWSYGQRCGAGSIETDLLVNLIRDKCPGKCRKSAANESLVAKVGGWGCGGTVAVLMERSDTARQALDRALDQYASQTGRSPRILPSPLPGALVSNVQRL